ncbi:LacI family DNA-binding transcriptional regulator [Acuticoccus kandeliae]|uniref:LacI family DNA-binding transcriptional regulator n=1 Tax=Acuticoccus kandeliae TaxID=2073160 RepID=UPI000D3E0FA6|nr:LacI family DNA-binding transcriptional regulator [Acuticoccus kandeliae]
MARPTIVGVAARAGVSTATVSKVVNGIESGVSEATRARVVAAIKELGYRPNRMGRSLRTLRHSTIGLAIVDPSPRFLADPFTTNLVAGISNHLGSQGFGLLLHGVRPGKLSESFLVRESDVDALCLNLCGERADRIAAMRLAAGLGQPVVIIQDRPLPGLSDAAFVRQDDKAGAAALAEHLLARKPRRALMVIADVAWPAVEHRVAGIRSVFEANGVALDIVACDETRSEAISEAISAALTRADPPDIIVGQNDQIAIIAIQVLGGLGLKVPHDVAVSGFNAFPFTGLAVPALTTVRSRAYELGTAAAKAILDRLETGRFASTDHLLPLDLIKGESA